MWQIFHCATCDNLEPSVTIILDDGDQHFKKINLGPNFS
jgi:hypothetical protein